MRPVDFKKIIGYFKFRKRREIEIRPLRDWKFIFVCFAVLLFIILLIDGYIFLRYKRGLSGEIKMEEVKTKTIDRNGLKEVLDEIMEREKRFEENTFPPVIKDPSL